MSPDLLADPRLGALFQGLRDRYRFVSVLGRGGAGTVFEVENRTLMRREALKVLMEFLSPEAVSRFIHEARTTALLDHPRIVRIYDYGEEQGYPWFAMQLVEGPSLASLLAGGRRFSVEDTARLAFPILDALAYSHGRGVIHRDLKPGNILVSLEGRPSLTDFGIAKAEGSVHQTQTGMMLGTPGYVAPEQARGLHVDARADQYALATTFYRMLTGRLPFESEAPMEVLLRRLQEDPEDLRLHAPMVPEAVAAVVMRGLAREREARWPDIPTLRQALAGACREAGVSWDGPFRVDPALLPQRTELQWETTATLAPFEPTADLPAARPRLRRRVLVFGAGGLLLAVGTWGFVRLRRPVVASPAPAPVMMAPVTQGSIAPAPAEPKPAAPTVARTPAPQAPAMDSPGRPVRPPQRLEDPPLTAFPQGCAGVRVGLSLMVDATGAVRACRVQGTVDPACAEAARAFALKLRFRPAEDAQGRAVADTLAIALEFPESP